MSESAHAPSPSRFGRSRKSTPKNPARRTLWIWRFAAFMLPLLVIAAGMSPKFIEGGQFSKGELLVRIDPREYELRLVQARANVAQSQTILTREQSEANLARADWDDLGREGAPTPLTLRAPQMAEAAAKLEAAKAQVDEAQLQLDRASLYAPFTGPSRTSPRL